MDPTNRPLEIVLGNQSVSLFFDFAAIRAFEKETGNHFMNWVASVTKQAQIMSLELMMIGTTEEAMLNDLDKMRFAELMGSVMSMTDFVTIVWAAAHTQTKPPRWLMTIDEVFTECDLEAYFKYAVPVMKAACDSVQRRKISAVEPEEKSGPTSPSATTMPVSGGKTSGESADVVLASLTKK
jgi:hypothetical protein